MATNKEIINKLVKIAIKQQKILTKLAQMAQETINNKSYLKNVWQTAGLNSGISVMSSPHVEYVPGELSNNITTSGSYTVSGSIPTNQRERFSKTFKAQIAAQKPELDGTINLIFND